MKIQKRIAIALALVVSAVFMTFKSVNISSAKLNDEFLPNPRLTLFANAQRCKANRVR